MSPGDFFAKRYLRVLPAHLIMGLGLVAFVLAAGTFGFAPRNPEWFAWDQLPAQLALVQSFGVHGGLGWNAPSWSVSALVGCYLAFPWLLRGMSRMGPWTVLAGVVGLYLAANALTWLLLDYPVYQMPMKFGFWRALPLFILGMGLAAFTEKVWINPRLAGWIGIASAALLGLIQLHDKHALVSLTLISLIILAAGAVPVTRPSKLVEKAAVASFAMFITNEPVRIVWFGLVNAVEARVALPVGVQWGLWAMGVAAAFAFAFAFNAVIDQPLQNRIKAWLKSRRRTREPLERGAVVSLEG